MDVCYFVIVFFRLAFILELVSADRPILGDVGHDHHHSSALDLDKQAVVSGHGGVFAHVSKQPTDNADTASTDTASADIKPEFGYKKTEEALEGNLKTVQKFKESQGPLNSLSNDVVKKSEEYGDSLEKLHKFHSIYDQSVKASRDFIANQQGNQVHEVQTIMGSGSATNKLVEFREVEGKSKEGTSKPNDPDVKHLADFEFNGSFQVNGHKFVHESEVRTALDEALAKDMTKDPDTKFLFCVNAETSLDKESKRTLGKQRIEELERIINEVANGKSIMFTIDSKQEYKKKRSGTIIYKTYPKSTESPQCHEDDIDYVEDFSKPLVQHGTMDLGESQLNFEQTQAET